MIENDIIIAKKYASAFLNLYGDDFSLDDIKKLSFIKDFFMHNKYFYIALSFPSIKLEVKEQTLSKLLEEFHFKSSIKSLINVLLQDNRIELLDKVLFAIWREYKKRKNIINFRIFSSHELDESEKKIMINFINKYLLRSIGKKQILTKFEVDHSLIAGLRIESSAYLWERSIRKELKLVGKFIAKKGIPCE